MLFYKNLMFSMFSLVSIINIYSWFTIEISVKNILLYCILFNVY